MDDARLQAFIRANLPILPVPGVPEIRVHKAVPTSGLNRLAQEDPDAFGTPYWAYHWAGGLALARHVLDHPETVMGKRVVDLGAGGGLVAIAAAKAGAAAVIAAEIDPYAGAALSLNAEVNRVEIGIVASDMIAGAAPDADVMLVGDLFYAPDLAMKVAAFLDRCAAAGATILVGDPWRAPLPSARLREIARYRVAETSNLAGQESGVFAWAADSGDPDRQSFYS